MSCENVYLNKNATRQEYKEAVYILPISLASSKLGLVFVENVSELTDKNAFSKSLSKIDSS